MSSSNAMCSGFSIYHSDTELGKAIRKYIPGNSNKISIVLYPDSVEVTYKQAQIEEELATAEGWDEVFAKAKISKEPMFPEMCEMCGDKK